MSAPEQKKEKKKKAQAFLADHHAPSQRDEVYGIGELAAELGTTARAIRFYEEKGLLSPTRAGQTRIYSRRERARLQLILRGKSLGISLREMKQYLDLYGERGEGRARQLEVAISRAGEMIEELEHKREELDRTLDELKTIRRVSQARLRKLRSS